MGVNPEYPGHWHCGDDGGDDDVQLHAAMEVMGNDALLPTPLLRDQTRLSQAGYQVHSLLLCGFNSCHFVITSRSQ